MTYINAFLTAMFAALVDTGVLLETAELVLIGDDFDEEPTLAEGDLTRPTYTGYADAAIAAWVAGVTELGYPCLFAAPIVFSPTNATNLPQYIYGAGILDANGDLVLVSKFSQAIQLSAALQQLHVTPKIVFQPDGGLALEASLG